MFTLELDLILTYIPPMSERNSGICLTRTIELPFPPYNGLQICGVQVDQFHSPEGFILKDVVWDMDREVFMGQIELVSHDLPMGEIPEDLSVWLDMGWQFGSYEDNYGEDEREIEEAESSGSEDEFSMTDPEFESQLEEPMQSSRKRSKSFNLVMRAMVRVMAEAHNDLLTAYAMDKTKRHFTEEQLKGNKSKPALAWIDAKEEFLDMGWSKQWDWREHVIKNHPRIDNLVKRQSR